MIERAKRVVWLCTVGASSRLFTPHNGEKGFYDEALRRYQYIYVRPFSIPVLSICAFYLSTTGKLRAY